MNKFLFFLLNVLLVFGCSDPQDDPFIPPEPTCNLDVTVIRCPLLPCDEENSEYTGNIEVQLFASEEDAILGDDRLASVLTDAGGRARFISIDCGEVWVKVNSEENGTYISYENLTLASTLNFHEVRFVGNYFYDNDDSAGLRQNHISLKYPTVGQRSVYRYFENNNHISFTPTDYTDVYLEVIITDQLDENSFIVQEYLGEIYGSLGGPTTGGGQLVVSNVWTITDDLVYVSPMQDNYFTSYVWGLTEYFEYSEADGYPFSLVKPEEDEINMETDLVDYIFGSYQSISISDYNLFGATYEDLIGDVASYNSLDGPIKLRVYSKEDGPIRYINFYDGGSPRTKGFDLVLN